MATRKSTANKKRAKGARSASRKPASSSGAKSSSQRCWPGYEPVPGKAQNEQGSCRKKAASKSSSSEKAFQAKRKRQIDRWRKSHKSSPRKAAQGLRKPGARTSTRRSR